MRLIGTTKQVEEVEKIAKKLQELEIPYSAESSENLDWGSEDYGTITWSFWVHEESDVPQALEAFQQATQHHETIEITPQESSTPIQKPVWGVRYFLGISILLFVLNAIFAYNPPHVYVDSPIQEKLLFDYPEAFQKSTPPSHLTFFPGIISLLKITQGNIQEAYHIFTSLPLFEKIGSGEIWRLITPAFLHSDIFHLLFNMFWLLILGRPLERLFGLSRFLLFSLGAALLANVAQYMATGAHFLGFSGVIAAYAGYIFATVREQTHLELAPLYEPARFIVGLILLLLVLSFLDFGLTLTLHKSIPITIANTAHLSGCIFGYLVGKNLVKIPKIK